MSVRLRCAIYTRKSTEEGLDQNFNSLHAQREACEAYVLSQAGEGWSAIKTPYDDGGFSGGSMERPALKQLLEDIRRGLIDVVVVYKVDRLTRSLADFAKIVEIFDARGVSFVSVTQAFNTTSSMGRLTLNVLLSFAQFEREVTGERIRDKVAASKAKGLRMGGRPPLGYDIVEGRLAINAVEAPRVRRIFERYLELGNLLALERDGHESKRWVNKAGDVVGGGVMTRGPLHYLLTNPAYRGATRHKDKLYDDTHPAIIDVKLWAAVQAKLAVSNASQPQTPRVAEPALLAGKLFDDRGNAMVPVHTRRGSQRYRYYVSRPSLTGRGEAGRLHRVSAGILEEFLAGELAPTLAASWMPEHGAEVRFAAAIREVRVGSDEACIQMEPDAMAAGGGVSELTTIRLAFHMSRRQGAQIIMGTNGDPPQARRVDRTLVRGVVQARRWMQALETGAATSITDLARREGLCNHYAARLLPLAYLAPDLVGLIIEGRQPAAITLTAVTAAPLPLNWDDQRAWFRALACG